MTPSQLESISFEGPHGSVSAHLARPHGQGPFPAVLLLQEGLGVTQHLLRLAQRFAQAGYLTLVPNFYSHEPAHKAPSESEVLSYLPLARKDDAQAAIAALPADQQASAQRVLARWKTRNAATYFPDAQAALRFLKQHEAVRADAIASVGFSFGGGLSAQPRARATGARGQRLGSSLNVVAAVGGAEAFGLTTAAPTSTVRACPRSIRPPKRSCAASSSVCWRPTAPST